MYYTKNPNNVNMMSSNFNYWDDNESSIAVYEILETPKFLPTGILDKEGQEIHRYIGGELGFNLGRRKNA